MIERYASLGDFARRAAQVPKGKRFMDAYSSVVSEWFGPLTYDRCVELCLIGEDTIVPRASAILDMIDAAVEVPMPAWTPSVYGAYPCVPEFLAGAPDCMRRMSPQVSDTSPVTVMVATDPAAGVTHEMMVTRGTAIIALVMKLNAVRPIKLSLISENVTYVDNSGEYLLVVDINTQPLDLATACFAIAGSSFARHLAFSVTAHNGHSVAWPAMHDTPAWIPRLQEIGLLELQDLFIPAARYEHSQIYSNPIAWVNAQVKRLTQALEEEAA